MLALRVLDVKLFVCLLQLVLESLLAILLSGQHTVVLQELLLEIVALNFLQIEVSLQAVIELLLLRKQLVGNLNDWIIIPEAVRILIYR